jgi:transcriptional regulator with XRE-family HTH domain
MSTLKQRMKELSPARRKKIEARAAKLVSEEMTLQELRQARKLTQVRMARVLRITQDGVSRLERRTDLLLSTLRKSVEAMGGSLSLIAEFPDREPVTISCVASVEPSLPASVSSRTRRLATGLVRRRSISESRT